MSYHFNSDLIFTYLHAELRRGVFVGVSNKYRHYSPASGPNDDDHDDDDDDIMTMMIMMTTVKTVGTRANSLKYTVCRSKRRNGVVT